MDAARKAAAARKGGAAAQSSADRSRGGGGGGAASLNPDSNNNQARSLSPYHGGYRAFPASLDALAVTDPPPALPVVSKFAASGQGGPPPSRAASLAAAAAAAEAAAKASSSAATSGVRTGYSGAANGAREANGRGARLPARGTPTGLQVRVRPGAGPVVAPTASAATVPRASGGRGKGKESRARAAGAAGGRRGTGGALASDARGGWSGVGSGEQGTADDDRTVVVGGGSGSKRRRTDLVANGSVVQGGTVQMAFEGGCYGSVQIHNKRYLAVMLEADEVAAGGAAMALCGGQTTRSPGLMDILNLRQAQGLMPNFDSINLRVCPISSTASLLAGASPSVPPRQQQLLQQKQLQRAQGSGEAAMEAVSQPVVRRPLRMVDDPAKMSVAEKKARRAARMQVVLLLLS